MTERFSEPFLSVRIGGDANNPERLLLIGRPVAGQVLVREWNSTSWNSEAREYEANATALLQEFQAIAKTRRPLSEELPRLEQWLQ